MEKAEHQVVEILMQRGEVEAEDVAGGITGSDFFFGLTGMLPSTQALAA